MHWATCAFVFPLSISSFPKLSYREFEILTQPFAGSQFTELRQKPVSNKKKPPPPKKQKPQLEASWDKL